MAAQRQPSQYPAGRSIKYMRQFSKLPVVFFMLICLSGLSAQEYGADSLVPRGPMVFAARIDQGLYYNHLPDYALHSLQYDGSLSVFMGGYLPDARLLIGGNFGIRIAPPPAASEFFSLRGLWGFTSSLDAEYLMGGFSLGLSTGASFYRYWNTRVLIMVPEIRIRGGFPLTEFPAGDRHAGLILSPVLGIEFRRDAALSLSAGVGLVLRR
jgi:hypothetical protein